MRDSRRSVNVVPLQMKPAAKFQGLGRALGVGSQMVAATGVGTAIGWWLDGKTGWSPVFLIIFFLLGSVAGFMSVYRAMQPDKKDRL